MRDYKAQELASADLENTFDIVGRMLYLRNSLKIAFRSATCWAML